MLQLSKLQKAENLFNSGKSLPVKQAVKLLQVYGFDVTYTNYTTYQDIKPEGQRYVTSRREVRRYEVIIKKDGKIIKSFDSGFTSHTAYSLTAFVINNITLKTRI